MVYKQMTLINGSNLRFDFFFTYFLIRIDVFSYYANLRIFIDSSLSSFFFTII